MNSSAHGTRHAAAFHVCALLVASSVPASAASPFTPSEIAAIRQASSATRDRDSLPGLQIAVARGDQIWSAGFGSADLEQHVAVDRYSMFRTASITKWLTATAANRLVEAGKLDLDAPIQQYCAQFPRKEGVVTSRLLLSHLSGIRHYYGANGEAPRTNEEREKLDERRRREQSTQYTRYTDVREPLNAFKDDPLVFEPGTRFLYSSLGFRLLACVLEGAAQRPYRVLMRELVFAPGGMQTITEDDALAIVPHRVAGYSRSPEGKVIRARFRDVSENLPAGGHLATADDLVRFAIAFNSGALVSHATRDRMIEHPNLADGQNSPFVPPFFGLGTRAYYGMGLFVVTMNDELVVAHTGNQSGASTELLLAPKRNVAVAVMTNMDGWSEAHALAMKIIEIVSTE